MSTVNAYVVHVFNRLCRALFAAFRTPRRASLLGTSLPDASFLRTRGRFMGEGQGLLEIFYLLLSEISSRLYAASAEARILNEVYLRGPDTAALLPFRAIARRT